MSHITEVKLKIRDLDALALAAEACGFDFREGQKTHAWYGRFLGDSNEGRQFARERGEQAMGKCEHALRLKDHKKGDYEIGIAKSVDGDGYSLLYDTFGPGRRLLAAAGSTMGKLKQEYAVAVATKNTAALARRGFSRPVRENLPDGRVRLRLRKR